MRIGIWKEVRQVAGKRPGTLKTETTWSVEMPDGRTEIGFPRMTDAIRAVRREICGPGDNGADEFEANADLFVAAPALLEALKRLEASAHPFSVRSGESRMDAAIRHGDERQAAHEQARAAIASAEPVKGKVG